MTHVIQAPLPSEPPPNLRQTGESNAHPKGRLTLARFSSWMISASASSAASSGAAPPSPCRSSSSSAAAGLENHASAVGRGYEVTGPSPSPGPRSGGRPGPARAPHLPAAATGPSPHQAARLETGAPPLRAPGLLPAPRASEPNRPGTAAPRPAGGLGPAPGPGAGTWPGPRSLRTAGPEGSRDAPPPAPSARRIGPAVTCDEEPSLPSICAKTHVASRQRAPPRPGLVEGTVHRVVGTLFLLRFARRLSFAKPWPSLGRRSHCRLSWRSS